MGIAIFIGIVIAYVAIRVVYGNWLEKGFRARTIETRLPIDQVRSIFVAKVARAGWKLVDDDNPLVAQSGLMAGRRQQISLRISSAADGLIKAHIEVPRFWRKNGIPYKAHTLRLRMNGFLTGVSAADPSCQVRG